MNEPPSDQDEKTPSETSTEASVNDQNTVEENGYDKASEIFDQQKTEAASILKTLLEENDGIVSTKKLRENLLENKIEDIDRHIIYLKHVHDPTKPVVDGDQTFRWFHRERSFYTKDAYATAEQEQEKEIEKQESELAKKEPKKNKKDEAVLCEYVKKTLEDIYDSEHIPENTKTVFDVHELRPQRSYQNVDLIAVDWVSKNRVEIVTVEVKLDFTAKAVHQAANYARFSHRVWIAILVDPIYDASSSALALKGEDQLLFEYSMQLGLGILACRRKDKSYEVFPIHWPRFQTIRDFEKETFIAAYEEIFLKSGLTRKPLF